MDPKAAQTWNFALEKFRTACDYLHKGQEDIAKTELVKSIYVGAGAVYYIYGKSEQDTKAHDAAQAFIAEMAAKQPEGTEAAQMARELLNFFSELAGPENHLPTI